MKTSWRRASHALTAALLIQGAVTNAAAQSGWKPEEPIAAATIDERSAGISVDNKSNRLISFWDSSSGVGSGFSSRPHLGPTSLRLGPSNTEDLVIRTDGAGDSLIAYDTNSRINTGFIAAGANFVTKPQLIGNTVGYEAGRVVDIHISKNGLGALIWIDNLGQPNVAFRASGADAEFDTANKVVLDTPPSSSAGSVFIARDEDGGAFAVWRRDQQYKQAYYNPQTGAFDVKQLTFIIPLGGPPSPGKINSGSLLNFEVGKNSRGDSVLAYAIYTSTTASVQPFNSITLVYAYRKRSTAEFGTQLFTLNPDDTEELYPQAAVLPDGRGVVTWLKRKLVPNPCTSGIAGPFINDEQEFRSVISDVDGETWSPLYSLAVDSHTTYIVPPTGLGVADSRVVIGLEKSFKGGQCLPQQTGVEFNLVRALWPSDKPSFSSSSEPVTVPGLNGQGGTPPVFSDIAAIGVSDIGTVGVLAAKSGSGFNKIPSLFVWESGANPDSQLQPTPTATPPTPTATPVADGTPIGGEEPSGDGCPSDPNKTAPGICGCGFDEIDSNGDAVVDCGAPGSITVRGGVLNNAPLVQPAGETLTIVMQRFANIVNSTARLAKAPARAKKIQAIYEVTATLRDQKSKCGKIKVTSKNNRIVLKKLIQGTYDVSYRLIFKQGTKKIGATTQSPSAQSTVSSGRTACPKKKKNKK